MSFTIILLFFKFLVFHNPKHFHTSILVHAHSLAMKYSSHPVSISPLFSFRYLHVYVCLDTIIDTEVACSVTAPWWWLIVVSSERHVEQLSKNEIPSASFVSYLQSRCIKAMETTLKIHIKPQMKRAQRRVDRFGFCRLSLNMRRARRRQIRDSQITIWDYTNQQSTARG